MGQHQARMHDQTASYCKASIVSSVSWHAKCLYAPTSSKSVQSKSLMLQDINRFLCTRNRSHQHHFKHQIAAWFRHTQRPFEIWHLAWLSVLGCIVSGNLPQKYLAKRMVAVSFKHTQQLLHIQRMTWHLIIDFGRTNSVRWHTRKAKKSYQCFAVFPEATDRQLWCVRTLIKET